MDSIIILTTDTLTSDDFTVAANDLTGAFDLHFDTDFIIEAFKRLQFYISQNIYTKSYLRDLMYCSLTGNLRLFIAIMYALHNDEHMPLYWCRYLLAWHCSEGTHRLGCYTTHDNTQKVYCRLYDYYEFNITDLVLTLETRIQIQKHIDNKVINVKRAVKK